MPLFVVLRDEATLDDALVGRHPGRHPRGLLAASRARRGLRGPGGAADALRQGPRGAGQADPLRRAGRPGPEPRLARRPRRAPTRSRSSPRPSPTPTGGRDDLRRRRRPLRADALPSHRAQRAEAPGDLARALEQLRRRPALRDEPRDRPPRVRSRDHALRPREQLRPALRLGRGDVRPPSGDRPRARTATSSSSRRRPATTCGPARTASGARGSTCSRASTRASAGWGSTTSTSSTRTGSTPRRRSRRRWARSTRPSARARRSTRGSRPTRPSRRARRRRSSTRLGTPLLIHQPSYSMLNRWIEDGLLDALGELGVGCIGFSPLAQGLLTDRYADGIPEDSRIARGPLPLARTSSPTRRWRRSPRLREIAAAPRPVARRRWRSRGRCATRG